MTPSQVSLLIKIEAADSLEDVLANNLPIIVELSDCGSPQHGNAQNSRNLAISDEELEANFAARFHPHDGFGGVDNNNFGSPRRKPDFNPHNVKGEESYDCQHAIDNPYITTVNIGSPQTSSAQRSVYTAASGSPNVSHALQSTPSPRGSREKRSTLTTKTMDFSQLQQLKAVAKRNSGTKGDSNEEVVFVRNVNIDDDGPTANDAVNLPNVALSRGQGVSNTTGTNNNHNVDTTLARYVISDSKKFRTMHLDRDGGFARLKNPKLGTRIFSVLIRNSFFNLESGSIPIPQVCTIT